MKTTFVELLTLTLCCMIGLTCKPGGRGLRGLLPNHSPVIAGLSGPSSVAVGDTAVLTCNAKDPDGDRLSFSWSCTNGTLSSASGPSTAWMPPGVSGSASVTVTVRDGRGGTDTQTRTMSVRQATADVLNWNGAVKARDYATWDSRLPEGARLNGTFSVDVHDINVYVFDDENYSRFRANNPRMRTGQKSTPLVSRERMEHGAFEVVVPHAGVYHIVLDNRYSWTTDKFCHIIVKATSP